MNKDLIKYVWNNLLQRKKRSFLTILSIFIGVMAIFALVSFGQGLSSYVDSISEQMGADKITIMSKGGFGNPVDSAFTFSEKDVEFVRKIQGVEEATGFVIGPAQVQKDLKDSPKYYYAVSYPEQKYHDFAQELFTLTLKEGRQLKDDDTNKVVVGYDYGEDNKIFSRGLDLGEKFFVNEKKVEVVGIYNSLGNPSDDRNIYFTENAMFDFLGVKREYQQIALRAAPGENPSDLADKIKKEFRKYKNQEKGKEDFTVQTFQELIESFSSILGVINGVLVIIGLISVLVAAVNIMNTMYTAVLERTQEIGIMKAVGAQNSSILFIFVFESGLLGIIGSTVGMGLGYLIAEAGGALAKGAGYALLQPAYPYWLIIGVLLFGFLMGVFSGLAPAVQASKQKPVDALRYE